MSHFTTIKSKLKNKEAAIKALREITNLEVEYYQEPQVVRNGYFAQDKKANIIARAKYPFSSDIGLLEEENEYSLVLDDYDLEKAMNMSSNQFLQKLLIKHNEFHVLEYIQHLNHERRVLSDGSIQYVVNEAL